MSEEPRHDTDRLSLDEIRALIDEMPDDTVTPPPAVAEAILDAQMPEAVSCPDCGRVFVPKGDAADGGTTLDDRTEAPTRPT